MPSSSIRILIAAAGLLACFALPACAQNQTNQDGAGFATWKTSFYALARQEGISDETLRAAGPYITFDPCVIRLDQKQPEKTQTYADYLANTVNNERIQRARQEYHDNQELLTTLEEKYRVPGEVLVAIWAMESNFGERQGDYNTITSLATLAYEGRRKDLFETELLDALQLTKQYNLKPDELTGSWAGAMGQCQFMPSSLLKYGVDQDSDGHVDIWNSSADALASIANYLQQNGWDYTVGISQNVKIPADFELDPAQEKLAKPVTEWHTLGVVRPTGAALYLSGAPATLVQPDGTGGQAFLAYDNFGVLMHWNRSTYFALAVADLAERINPKLKNPHS